jgi:thioredoxin-like negative regulator of GroEL
MHEEGAAIAKLIPAEADEAGKIRDLYRRILARDPTGKELDLARTYLAKGTLEQYARILLSVNEEIFWP